MKRSDAHGLGMAQGALFVVFIDVLVQGIAGKERVVRAAEARWVPAWMAVLSAVIVLLVIWWTARTTRRTARIDRGQEEEGVRSATPSCPEGVAVNRTDTEESSIEVRFVDDADVMSARPAVDADTICSKCWSKYHYTDSCRVPKPLKK